MSDDNLQGRARDLAASAFSGTGADVLGDLAGAESQTLNRRALAVVSGITDEALLDQLLALGLDGGTVAAMTLVPLVHVAWADGEVQSEERQAILRAAASSGIEPGKPGFSLLESWLTRRPDASLISTWKSYVAALAASLDGEGRDKLREQTLGRAKSVAAAAGGFLGMAKISAEEKSAIDELATVFD